MGRDVAAPEGLLDGAVRDRRSVLATWPLLLPSRTDSANSATLRMGWWCPLAVLVLPLGGAG